MNEHSPQALADAVRTVADEYLHSQAAYLVGEIAGRLETFERNLRSCSTPAEASRALRDSLRSYAETGRLVEQVNARYDGTGYVLCVPIETVLEQADEHARV